MSVNRGMNKEDVVHIYNGILLHYNWVIFLILQAIKKDEIMPFAATWMDLETVILSAVSQRRNTVWRPLYVPSKKKWNKWTYSQNRYRPTDSEEEVMVARRGGWQEGPGRESGLTCTHLYLKWTTTRPYCTEQGTLLDVMWQPGWEGRLGENGYMCMQRCFAVQLKLSQHC